MRPLALALALLLAAACASEPEPHGSSSAVAASATPSASASPARTGRGVRWPSEKVTARHSAAGVRRLVLRAGSQQEANVTVDASATEIVVSGVPTTWGIDGEPSKAEGGFAFASFGDTLLAATRGEFIYIHFGVVLDDLEITVPPDVTVTRERMRLNQDQAADLRPPGASARPEGRP